MGPHPTMYSEPELLRSGDLKDGLALVRMLGHYPLVFQVD